MEIKTDYYTVEKDNSQHMIKLQGALRLSGMAEYAPIIEMFDETIAEAPERVMLDLRELDFLNSSGINVLSKFVIKVRQKETIGIVVKGSQKIPWQGKSLRNLQRLMPSLELQWD